MKKTLFITVATLICGSMLFTSCKKKEHEDNDTEGAKDHAMCETHSNDITNIGSQASYANMTTYRQGTEQVYTSCATITFDTLNNADNDTLIVDFGTGCTGLDNRVRKGVLQFIYSVGKHYRDSGNVINVSTPSNTYFVDNNQVIINNKTNKLTCLETLIATSQRRNFQPCRRGFRSHGTDRTAGIPN